MCFKILEVSKHVWKEKISNYRRARGEGCAERAGNIHGSASLLAGCAIESAGMHSDLTFHMWHYSEYTFSATNGTQLLDSCLIDIFSPEFSKDFCI